MTSEVEVKGLLELLNLIESSCQLKVKGSRYFWNFFGISILHIQLENKRKTQHLLCEKPTSRGMSCGSIQTKPC
jgi:hypothetical protein